MHKQRKIRKKSGCSRHDMSSYDEMMKFVSRVKEEASHVDWLINNVGISTYAKYEDYTFNEWTKIVNTNLSVPVFLVKELRPIMSEGGSILFTGSYAGQQAYSSSLVLRRHQIRHSFPYQIPGKRTGTKADPGQCHCPGIH